MIPVKLKPGYDHKTEEQEYPAGLSREAEEYSISSEAHQHNYLLCSKIVLTE